MHKVPNLNHWKSVKRVRQPQTFSSPARAVGTNCAARSTASAWDVLGKMNGHESSAEEIADGFGGAHWGGITFGVGIDVVNVLRVRTLLFIQRINQIE